MDDEELYRHTLKLNAKRVTKLQVRKKFQRLTMTLFKVCLQPTSNFVEELEVNARSNTLAKTWLNFLHSFRRG